MVELLADRILGDEQTCTDLIAYFEVQMRPRDARVRRRIAAMAQGLLWMFTASASAYGVNPGVPMIDAGFGCGYHGMDGWMSPYGLPGN